MIGERPDAKDRSGADDQEMRRILIATDGSPATAEATRVGLALAVDQGAAVTFVHVVSRASATLSPTLAAVSTVGPLPTYEDKLALDAGVELAAAAGIDANVVIVAGDAADEIVAYADMIDADLIVIGSRGRGAVKGLLLGSVSQAILHEARRPVLVARS